MGSMLAGITSKSASGGSQIFKKLFKGMSRYPCMVKVCLTLANNFFGVNFKILLFWQFTGFDNCPYSNLKKKYI